MLVSQVKLFEHIEMTKDQVKQVHPENEIGYLVKFEGGHVGVIMGKRDGTSKNCTTMLMGVSFSESVKLVEENFRARKLEKFKQGMSEFAAYAVELIGFKNRVGISIPSTGRDSTISVFEY